MQNKLNLQEIIQEEYEQLLNEVLPPKIPKFRPRPVVPRMPAGKLVKSPGQTLKRIPPRARAGPAELTRNLPKMKVITQPEPTGAPHIEPEWHGSFSYEFPEAPGDLMKTVETNITKFLEARIGHTEGPTKTTGAHPQTKYIPSVDPSGPIDVQVEDLLSLVRTGEVSYGEMAKHLIEYDPKMAMHLSSYQEKVEGLATRMVQDEGFSQRFFNLELDDARQEKFREAVLQRASQLRSRQKIVPRSETSPEAAAAAARAHGQKYPQSIEHPETSIYVGQTPLYHPTSQPLEGPFSISDPRTAPEDLAKTQAHTIGPKRQAQLDREAAKKQYIDAYENALLRARMLKMNLRTTDLPEWAVAHEETMKKIRSSPPMTDPGGPIERVLGPGSAQDIKILYNDKGFTHEGLIPTDYNEIKKFMEAYGVEKYNQLYGAIPGVSKVEDLVEAFIESGLGPKYWVGEGRWSTFQEDMSQRMHRRREAARQRWLRANPPPPPPVRATTVGAQGQTEDHRWVEQEVRPSLVRGQLDNFESRQTTYNALGEGKDMIPVTSELYYDRIGDTGDPMPHTIEPGHVQTSWRNRGYSENQRDAVLGVVSHLSNNAQGLPLRALNDTELNELTQRYGAHVVDIYTHMMAHDPILMFAHMRLNSPRFGEDIDRNPLLRVALGEVRRSEIDIPALEKNFRGRDYSPLDLAEFLGAIRAGWVRSQSRPDTNLKVENVLRVYEVLQRTVDAHEMALGDAATRGRALERAKINALLNAPGMRLRNLRWAYANDETQAQRTGRPYGDRFEALRQIEDDIPGALERVAQNPKAHNILKDLVERGELKQMLDEFKRVRTHPGRLGISNRIAYDRREFRAGQSVPPTQQTPVTGQEFQRISPEDLEDMPASPEARARPSTRFQKLELDEMLLKNKLQLQKIIKEEKYKYLREQQKDVLKIDVVLRYEKEFSFYGNVLNQIRAIQGITIAKAHESGVVSVHPDKKQIILHLKFIPDRPILQYASYLKTEFKKIKDAEGEKVISVRLIGFPTKVIEK